MVVGNLIEIVVDEAIEKDYCEEDIKTLVEEYNRDFDGDLDPQEIIDEYKVYLKEVAATTGNPYDALTAEELFKMQDEVDYALKEQFLCEEDEYKYWLENFC